MTHNEANIFDVDGRSIPSLHPNEKMMNRCVRSRTFPSRMRRRSAQLDQETLMAISNRRRSKCTDYFKECASNTHKNNRLIPTRYTRRDAMLPFETLRSLCEKSQANVLSMSKTNELRHKLATRRVLEKPNLKRFDSADFFLKKAKTSGAPRQSSSPIHRRKSLRR